MPWADHLISDHQTRDSAVSNGDQKTFITHGGELQDTPYRLVQLDSICVECLIGMVKMCDLAVHLRWLTQEGIQWHVYGFILKGRVMQLQPSAVIGLSDDGEGCALTLTEITERFDIIWMYGEDIAFL